MTRLVRKIVREVGSTSLVVVACTVIVVTMVAGVVAIVILGADPAPVITFCGVVVTTVIVPILALVQTRQTVEQIERYLWIMRRSQNDNDSRPDDSDV